MASSTSLPSQSTLFQKYHSTPLYLRILVALVIGIFLGVVLGYSSKVELTSSLAVQSLFALELISKIVLQLLGALAPPLILIAVIHVLMNTEIPGRSAGRLVLLLLLNTLVAIFIGLLVTNTLKPGTWFEAEAAAEQPAEENKEGVIKANPIEIVVRNVPRSLLGPLGDQANIIGVIFIAVAFGIAFRRLRERPLTNARELVQFAYDALIIVLHWIIDLVPFGVLCIVAHTVGVKGFGSFVSLGAFVITVLIALTLQSCWYLLRIKYFSWCKPFQVLRGMRDALLMAFSTGSSTATMPVTYKCLRENVKLREKSASLGSLVGANFNNDGTALYEAAAAIFIAQTIGMDLTIVQQLLIVLTSVVASVGAAGIPEAGLVTMTLVFTAVGLPTQKIATLLAVDWFLDRCRTMVNVLGDVNVSCLLDGKTSEESEATLESSSIATTSPESIVSNVDSI